MVNGEITSKVTSPVFTISDITVADALFSLIIMLIICYLVVGIIKSYKQIRVFRAQMEKLSIELAQNKARK